MEVDSLNIRNNVNRYKGSSTKTDATEAVLADKSNPAPAAKLADNSVASVQEDLHHTDKNEGAANGVNNLNNDDRHVMNNIEKAVNEVNKKLQIRNHSLTYDYHEATKTIIAKVIDNETKQVIREIPPQKRLDAVAKMWELAGIIVDEKG